ncbi:MAG: magnesium chelatase [Firmicutes bacterium]|nr:magnesium chelatase [Bacillota bacterium]
MKPYHRLARHSGNSTLFDMVEMSIISNLWGEPLHIHAEGLRGTGKTTIMRTARNILPPIQRIKGCLYNCDPKRPHCPNHRHLSPEEVKALGTEMIPMPFLEISHSAKIATVAGSIDLARITDPTNPTAALLPGIIPQAHRGIIFIDEINRLADTSPEITDVLLDVMGTKPGRIQIEEAGLSHVEIPVQVSVWAASNPDEEPGPLEENRKQLSDRFDLVLYMGRPTSIEVVSNILLQSEISRQERLELVEQPLEGDTKYGQQLSKIAEEFKGLTMPDYLRNFISRLYLKYNIESLRAIEAIQQGAILHCALRRRKQVLVSDILRVIPLALKHRVDGDTLTRVLNNVDAREETVISFPGTGLAAATQGYPAVSEFENESQTGVKTTVGEQVQSTPPKRNRSLLEPIRSFFSGGGGASQQLDSGLPMPRARRLGALGKEELIRSENDFKRTENQ